MKKAFVIKVKTSQVSFFFRYFNNGFLESYHYQTEGEPPAQAQKILKDNFPFYITGIDFFRQVKIFNVHPVTPDLSFKKFWDTYGHKQGKKARAERLWKQLSLAEKAKAMAYIRTYDNFLYMNKGIAKAYPETYLNQKRWENED